MIRPRHPVQRYLTRDDVPPCEFCDGTGVIQGPFPLECPKCMGCKKDVEALAEFRRQRREGSS